LLESILDFLLNVIIYPLADLIRDIAMFILFLFLVLSAGTPHTIASGNATTETVGWVSDPGGRGTFGLILSCLLTLGICVWSAMHLNIPPQDEPVVRTWIRHTKWGLVGVVAPELVVFAAWRQYNSARELHAQVTKIIEGQDGTKVYQSDDSRYPSLHIKKTY
jgi:hypothetical protein